MSCVIARDNSNAADVIKIASAVRNIFNVTGTREPSKAKIPSAKAMSVPVGMAQPRSASGSPQLI